jgi:hypothetical protein
MSEGRPKQIDDLWKESLRMVVVLVGACVLFVGIVSLGAVFLTTRVFASPGAKEPLVANKTPVSI